MIEKVILTTLIITISLMMISNSISFAQINPLTNEDDDIINKSNNQNNFVGSISINLLNSRR